MSEPTKQTPTEELSVARTGPQADLELETKAFEFHQRKAKMVSSSSMVPKEFQGANGIPNVMVAMEMANRMNMPLMAIMQNIVIIHSRPSWKASFLVAVINLSGKFGLIQYKHGAGGKIKWKNVEYENLSCRVVTTDRRSGEKIEGPLVTMEMALKDGWADNEKYRSIPETMLQWRAVSFFARAVCPELTLGLPAADELELIPQPGHTTYSSDPNFRRPKIEPTPQGTVTVEQADTPPPPLVQEEEDDHTPIEELLK